MTQKLEPGLKSVADLANMENFGEIVNLVQNKGLDMVTAYKAVNYGKAVQSGTAAGRQAAINAARGKGHLASHGGANMPGKEKTRVAGCLRKHVSISRTRAKRSYRSSTTQFDFCVKETDYGSYF